MLVETTTLPFDTREEAEDSIAGSATFKGFIFGYVTEYGYSKKFRVVIIFDSPDFNSPSDLGASQREVLALNVGGKPYRQPRWPA